MTINITALDFMWHGGDTRRYHGIRPLMEDTVGHHSFNVACIIMHQRPEASVELLRAALKHDLAEHKVGDIPAPTKRALPCVENGLSFREHFGIYEAETAIAHGVDLENDLLSTEDAWVLKFADAVDGMRFCIRERELGNNTSRLHAFYDTFKHYVGQLVYGEDNYRIIHERHLKPARHAQPQDVELFNLLAERWCGIGA